MPDPSPEALAAAVASGSKLPSGLFPYTDAEGNVGVLSGRIENLRRPTSVISNWVQKVHPLRNDWVSDELRQRASYIGTSRHLAPFIVPHRFEGKVAPNKLARAKLGYGIGLNKAYLHEVFGHIRGTPAHYTWGVLGGAGDKDTTLPPTGGVANRYWWDVTGDGVSWRGFFEGKILEWMLTSPGGFVLADSNRPEGIAMTQATADRLGIRAFLKFIPMSWVEDFGTGPNGYRWVKLGETLDAREPRDEETGGPKYFSRHVLYTLQEDGRTLIERFDDDGNRIGAPVYQKVVDTYGRGILPLVEVKFGEHPDIPLLGSGLLMGLDDIVIDLYNLLTEIREAYRDEAFSFNTYKGNNADEAYSQLRDGSRWVNLGDDPQAKLDRIAADAGGVSSGVELFNIGLKNWSLSAKRRAMEILEASSARSGISLKAEFQLDLRPLLVAVTESLDHIETNSMYVLAQILGNTSQQADLLLVRRETDFQLEQEASRIARIVDEFLSGIPAMPKSLLQKLIMRWAASLDFLHLDEKEKDGKTLREMIEAEATEISAAAQKAVTAPPPPPPPGVSGGKPGGPGGKPSDKMPMDPGQKDPMATVHEAP